MSVSTDEARTFIKTTGGPLQILLINLLCDILDELRQNPANRQQALEKWKAHERNGS